jgi:hypothetical protein
VKLFAGYGQNSSRNHNVLGYKTESGMKIELQPLQRQSPEKTEGSQIKAAYFPKSVSPESKVHSQSTLINTLTPGFSNLPKINNDSMNMSYNKVLDAVNKSDEKISTLHAKSWKYFGPKNQPENEPGLGAV